MSKESYNNVEITQEELTALEEVNSVEGAETTESQVEEIQSPETEPMEETSQEATESPEVNDSFEYEGETYDRDTILKWREDSTNKDEWSKSNTEKAQNLSKWNKLADKINGDEEFRSHIKDYFFDNESEYGKLGLDGKIEIEGEETDSPINSEMDERLSRLESSENERVIESRVDTLENQLEHLENDNPLHLGEPAQVEEFLDFVDKNATRFMDGEIPNLQNAYKEWSYNAVMDELAHYKKLNDNQSKNEGTVIGRSEMGAKDTQTPKHIKNYKDIDIKDPDIAKYFDE